MDSKTRRGFSDVTKQTINEHYSSFVEKSLAAHGGEKVNNPANYAELRAIYLEEIGMTPVASEEAISLIEGPIKNRLTFSASSITMWNVIKIETPCHGIVFDGRWREALKACYERMTESGTDFTFDEFASRVIIDGKVSVSYGDDGRYRIVH